MHATHSVALAPRINCQWPRFRRTQPPSLRDHHHRPTSLGLAVAMQLVVGVTSAAGLKEGGMASLVGRRYAPDVLSFSFQHCFLLL